jgi:hypothetical protein
MMNVPFDEGFEEEDEAEDLRLLELWAVGDEDDVDANGLDGEDPDAIDDEADDEDDGEKGPAYELSLSGRGMKARYVSAAICVKYCV